MKRYYCPKLESNTLTEHEAHHCVDVMRQREGDVISVFDGRGQEWTCIIESAHKKSVKWRKVSERIEQPLRVPVILAQAITKPKSMDLIVQKATELGASEIIPLRSDRSLTQLDEDRADSKREKWQQVAVEACKQCGQNWIPNVGSPMRVRDFVTYSQPFGLRLIASFQKETRPLKDILRGEIPEAALSKGVVLMVGPEGDFTPSEIESALEGGFIPVSLGPLTFRSETAAFFSLSAVIYEYQD
jgi:16S rRNA (uracil1498-N3)-methyltransferase